MLLELVRIADISAEKLQYQSFHKLFHRYYLDDLTLYSYVSLYKFMNLLFLYKLNNQLIEL